MINFMQLRYDSYYRYRALTEALEDFQRNFPDLAKLCSIGTGFDGRDIWCMELTCRKTGPADDKPGFYLDGNTHAVEVTGSMACLYTIDWLLSNYGKNDQATRILNDKVIYVIPRVCPDGAELYLTTAHSLRSSVREWHFPHFADPSGLSPEDIDGDGQILQMRVRDDLAGDWKISPDDARLMIRRRPDDFGGAYYKLYTEGLIENYNGVAFDTAPPRWGIDMNRNYPVNWKPPHIQAGAGDVPLSEPESRAIAEFLTAKRNIAGAIYHHTAGGMILRPNCTEPDDKLPAADLADYKVLGARAEEITGYPVMDIYGVFAGNTAQWGTFMDLSYEHLGISSFAVELWDLAGRSGIKEKSFADVQKLSLSRQEENQLKMLKWNDEVMNGECFAGWRPFTHPQLGEVELGGWIAKQSRHNPPIKLLEEECEKATRFTLMHIESLPRLCIRDVKLDKVGENIYRVCAAIENIGFLSSSSTQKAADNRATAPCKAALCGGKVLQCEQEITLGHLKGLGAAVSTAYVVGSAAGRVKKAEWLVEAAPGTELCITAWGERAGTVRHKIVAQ